MLGAGGSGFSVPGTGASPHSEGSYEKLDLALPGVFSSLRIGDRLWTVLIDGNLQLRVGKR